MKIYMDDERNLPEGFDILVRNVNLCLKMIVAFNGQIKCLSLDHDMGTDETGYTVSKFLEESAFNNISKEIPILLCHSQNPVGKKNIEMSFGNARKYWERYKNENR